MCCNLITYEVARTAMLNHTKVFNILKPAVESVVNLPKIIIVPLHVVIDMLVRYVVYKRSSN